MDGIAIAIGLWLLGDSIISAAHIIAGTNSKDKQ
jgi:hypothetical protein